MDIIAVPDSVDVQAFQFKRQRCVKVFDAAFPTLPTSLNLVAAASRLGVLFVGSPNNSLHVFQVRSLLAEEGPQARRRVFPLAACPVNLSLNCTQDLLCIVTNHNNSLVATIYLSKSCASENLSVFKEIRLSPSSGIQLCGLLWNPCVADILAVCTSDGSLSVYQCKQTSLDVQAKLANARCLSWSPKGKQIVTGNADGSLSQYKPDLTLVKNIPPPQLFGPNHIEAISIHWISNYQFGIVYKDAQNPDNRPSVTIVNTPKAGAPNCFNYEDICYSTGVARPIQYYLSHFPTWGILLALSANSMEVGVLGTGDQLNWQQWIQMDDARAELPLTESKQENYPIGFAYDDAAIHQLSWGENETLPHMPMVHVLSHTGTLVTFFAINFAKDSPPLCSPPQELTIPDHWMIFDTQPKAQQPAPAALPETPSHTQQDISFLPQNVATSTPTIPKSSSPFSQTGTKPVANLFGGGGGQDLQQVVKPLADSERHQNSGEVKPQQNAASKVSSFLPKPAPQAQPEKPFSGFAKPSNLLKQPPPAQPEKVPEVQQVQSVTSQVANAIKAQQDEEQAKSYETLLNQASNETIKALLLKEINEFQMELYDLLKRCKSIDTTVGTASEMKEIIAVMEQYDREPPESIWSKQDVTQQITALKQSLFKMCSVLVKAQMQPETLELEQLAVLDPVSSGKLSAMKQNIYYIESQLKQVNNVLDDQWDMFQGECKKRMKAFRGLNDGDSMKLPTLDKVYQPLVRQHDILARQESTIRALQKLAESVKPQMLSSQIGRSLTNAYKDSHPLSALTKNLLKMSLQPIDVLDAKHKAICEREAKHTSKKQNALRELLVNHHTVRIKPTKVEQSNRLQSFFDRNSLSSFEPEPKKEIENIPVNNILKEPVKSAVPETGASKLSTLNSKMMEAILRPTPQFSDNNQPLINLNKFVSNIPERAKPSTPAVPTSTTASKSTYSDKIVNQSPLVTALLQNKTPQQSAKPENVKTNVSAVIAPSTAANVPTSVVNNQKSSTFMGQPICSPTPRSTGSIFGTATSPQVSFGSSTGNSIFSLPKQTTSSSATNATSSESSAFKSFAPPPASKETSIFLTPKPQTTTPSSQGGVRNEVPSLTQESEKSGSSLTIGSLTISKVPSASTPISVPSPAAVTFTGSISSVSGTPPTTGSIFSPTSVPATSKPSAAPAVTTSAPPPSFTLSNAILTSSEAADSLFTQSSPSTTSLPFRAQSTSIFGSTGSSSATSIFGGTSVSTTAAPAVSVSVSPPSVDTAAKLAPQASAVTTTLVTTPPISSPPAASSIFGSVSNSPTPASVFSQSPPPQSVFGGTGATPGSVFGTAASTTTSSMFGGTVTSTPGFGSTPQAQPAAANSLFASANANITPGGSMFEALSVSPTSSPSSIFGSVSTDTNASSIFGAANAAVPSTIASLFGNASIATTSAPFGSPSNTGGSVFGGGAGFGSPSAFGQSGGSVFGGGGSAFGQPQTNAFGGGVGFGGFGATSPPASNIFGQAPVQTGGTMFGSPASPVSQGSLFGGGSIQQGQSMFGTPTPASPQQGGSIFGSPTGQSSIFGGAATFGSKPVFGQTNSFGGSPTGSGGFGAFSGTGDQQNVASAGFGSPSAFSKPPGTFGGSPSFGSPTGFGAPSTFAPSFSSPIKPFGPPGTDSAFGNSQSSTFENLATQSTIGFGNLAQQSPPAQPAAPAFQGNPSFSMWR